VGYTTYLWCDVDRYHIANLEWRFYGLPLPSNVRKDLGQGYVKIEKSEVKDSGVYTCMGSNMSVHSVGFVEVDIIGVLLLLLLLILLI